MLAWTEPARSRLGIEVGLPERNGAQRAREALDAGVPIEDVYREAVAETKRTYTAVERVRETRVADRSRGRGRRARI